MHISIEHSLTMLVIFFTELIKLRSAHGTLYKLSSVRGNDIICECSSTSSNKVVGGQIFQKVNFCYIPATVWPIYP
jgi:hypothetical protein